LDRRALPITLRLWEKTIVFNTSLFEELLIPVLLIFPGKNDPHIGVPAGFMGSGWGKSGSSSRFKRLYKPLDEVQICRILTNGAIIGHILHRN
jgi:hypothetical protein